MEVTLSRKVDHEASLIRVMNGDNEVSRIFKPFDNPSEVYNTVLKIISDLERKKLL